jgi:hypothetical protein
MLLDDFLDKIHSSDGIWTNVASTKLLITKVYNYFTEQQCGNCLFFTRCEVDTNKGTCTNRVRENFETNKNFDCFSCKKWKEII